MEEEDNEFFILVAGVLAAIILVVCWWFISGRTTVPTQSVAAPEAAQPAEAEPADDRSTEPEADLTLLPPAEETEPTATAEPEPAEPELPPTVFDAIAADPNLSVVADLLRTQGLDSALAGAGPFTVFAPSNDAISDAASSDTTVTLIEAAPDDVLSYHVVPGQLSYDDLVEFARGSRSSQLETLAGEPLSVRLEGETIVVNNATMIVGDPLAADNGVVHRIDNVLVPPVAALNTLVELEPILFASGSALIEADSFATLDQLNEVLQASDVSVSIEGHTDSSGDAVLNQNLSQSRARSVLNYLVANNIEESRLSAIGFGSSVPVADNNTEEGRALNRRIEFELN